MKKNKLKYPNMSKLLIALSQLVFISFTIIGFIGTFKSTSDSITDTTVFVTAITISGCAFTLANKHYYKKAQAENLVKIQATTYKQIMDIRLNYNEKMLQLKQKYNVSNEEIQEIESESPIDDISEETLNGINGTIANELYSVKENIDIDN